MIPWTRPQPHPRFAETAERVAGKVQKAVDERGHPHGDDFKGSEIWGGSWKESQHPDGLHKTTLVGEESWYAKCHWCEQHRPPRRELDVEHYRPKVEITEWVGEPRIVSDTPPAEVRVGFGYWWLAFEWSNYSLACGTCNRGWKRNLFPVSPPRAACVVGIEAIETPLLINPASVFRAGDHFRWTIDGHILPCSDAGRATIITVGLNRRDLVVRRAKVANDTVEALTRFKNALLAEDERALDTIYDELAELGSRRAEFTSMARWFIEQDLQCQWHELGMPP